ncbi:MAG TPA: polysaccharide biosynthesis/export family protein [Pyrinomonadaceae bacterium]|nr:polysaccharide biosynthesis/export family protein [Pyrinomonadaceae bacterium]
MLKSLTVAAVFVVSFVCADLVCAQTGGTKTTQSLALTNHSNDAGASRPTEKAVTPEARAAAKKLYKEGVKYGLAGLHAQAAATFEKVVALDPQFADAYFSLGHAYFDMKRWAEAAKNLDRALELNPKDVEAQDRLSFARTMLQPYGGGTKPIFVRPARTVQTKSVELNPVAPKAVEPKQSAPTQQPVGSPVSVATKTAGPTTVDKEEEVSDNKTNTDESALTRIYRIGANDVLDIRVSDSTSSQSTLFTVTPTGFLEHPLLGEPMQVGGLTVDEITARIEGDLKRRALDNTKVTVGVRDYASHAILVSGLVKDAGTKILRREAIPLYVVVADAQPLPEAARVTVMRNESNQLFEIELTQSSDMNLLVRPGDVITLHANATQFLYVGGEVKFPGEKTYRRGLTLTQAIIAAGGLLDKPKEIRLGRDDGRGFLIVTKFKLKDIESGKAPDPLVRPGDRITVVK